jgi:purine-nucleoside/S-methyl-5'-thioadenosine phosphorylase / adenosine deaminase
VFVLRDTCDLDPGRPRVEVAFTDGSIDLQENKPGLESALAAVVEATGVRFARLHQVHGDVVLDAPADSPRPGDDAPVADALVTDRPGIGLMIRVADCVPVLLADPRAGVVGAVHAGRKGVVLDLVGRTVDRMRALGAENLRAWVGPHVCGRCYEVPADLREEVAAVVPTTYAETSWGTPSLDLGAGVAAQLSAAGVEATQVDRCTLEDESLHSYRRDGARSGRLAGLVWLA